MYLDDPIRLRTMRKVYIPKFRLKLSMKTTEYVIR